ALVEMSPRDYGRDVLGLRRGFPATGGHIVCTTGVHKEKFCAAWVKGRSVGLLAAGFFREVATGIDGTHVRAGGIQAGSSLDRITVIEEKVFRAAARAQRMTGAPISTHTEAGTYGLEQIALLQSEGADLTRVILGHVDRKLDWDYHLALAQTGAYLGYDQISKEKYAPDARRGEFILRLGGGGDGQQILLAHDLGGRAYLASHGTGGGAGATYILLGAVTW